MINKELEKFNVGAGQVLEKLYTPTKFISGVEKAASEWTKRTIYELPEYQAYLKILHRDDIDRLNLGVQYAAQNIFLIEAVQHDSFYDFTLKKLGEECSIRYRNGTDKLRRALRILHWDKRDPIELMDRLIKEDKEIFEQDAEFEGQEFTIRGEKIVRNFYAKLGGKITFEQSEKNQPNLN